MGFYTDKLKRYRSEFKARYDEVMPNAIGDEKLLEIQRHIEQVEEQMVGKKECPDCDGWGVTECDCCGHERDCENGCDAGLIDK